jgi:hypothetical protein
MNRNTRQATTTILLAIVFSAACGRETDVVESTPKAEKAVITSKDPYLGTWVNVKNRKRGFQIESEGEAYVIQNEDGDKFVGTKTAGVLRMSNALGSVDFLHVKSTDHLVAAGEEYKRFDASVNYPIRAMADMRSIATGVESYAIDHLQPSPCTGYPTGTIENVANSVMPLYIKRFPGKDPWGNPFYYRTDGCSRYVLVSGGADGQLPADVESDTIFEPSNSQADDIVFANARFVRIPPGIDE